MNQNLHTYVHGCEKPGKSINPNSEPKHGQFKDQLEIVHISLNSGIFCFKCVIF